MRRKARIVGAAKAGAHDYDAIIGQRFENMICERSAVRVWRVSTVFREEASSGVEAAPNREIALAA